MNGTEESLIDHFIVCQAMFRQIVSLQVDEERKYSLTKFTNKRGTRLCSQESDDNTLILEVNQEWKSTLNEVEIRHEILNYKNKEEFETFIKLTDDSEELRTCFDDDNEDMENSSKKWLKYLKIILKASFSKIRIKRGKLDLDPKLQLLFQEKETLRTKIGQLENKNKFEEIKYLQELLETVDERIATICANKNKKIVHEYLGKTEDTIEGYNQAKTWGLTKKLSFMNTIEPPCAKKDKNGYLVADKEAL